MCFSSVLCMTLYVHILCATLGLQAMKRLDLRVEVQDSFI